MRTLLIVLTVLEVTAVVAVVAVYLVAIERSLHRSSVLLGKVAFGVRAIEQQTAPVGPRVVRVNEQLAGIAAALDGVATLAEGGSTDGRRSRRRRFLGGND